MQSACDIGEPKNVPHGFQPTEKNKSESKEMQQFIPNYDQEKFRGQESMNRTINELNVEYTTWQKGKQLINQSLKVVKKRKTIKDTVLKKDFLTMTHKRVLSFFPPK